MEVFSNFSHLCSLLLLLLWNYCVPRLPPEIFSKFLCSDCLLWVTLSHPLLVLPFFFLTYASLALIIFDWSSLPSSLLHTAACLFILSFSWFLPSNVSVSLWRRTFLIVIRCLWVSSTPCMFWDGYLLCTIFSCVSKETESRFCLSFPGCSES